MEDAGGSRFNSPEDPGGLEDPGGSEVCGFTKDFLLLSSKNVSWISDSRAFCLHAKNTLLFIRHCVYFSGWW